MTHTLRRLACCAALGLALAACSQAPDSAPASETTTAAVPATEGTWSIDSAASHLDYVSIKAGEVAEANRFDKLTGSVGADGAARIEIDLASVNTGVEIRDERMREIFFQVAEFPSAVVTAQLDPAQFAGLEVGKVVVQPLAAKVSIKGMEAPIETEVQIARVADGRVLATTTKPIIITTDMFGLTDELGELRALAQLPSISPAVPVTFTLAFTRS
ncbi:MAG: YceI family protein [Porphyrobacter sp.]|nr:YceI family protein [Porphyrobacter sp.]